MVTTKCVVDMGKGNLEMSVEDQKATFNLFGGIKHPKEDEAKPIVNLTDYSSIFLGPKQAKTRATPDIPPALPPTVPLPDVFPPPTSQTSLPFSQLEQLLPMLHSLYHDQYLLMESFHHFSLQ
ncbi:hypothetical protein GmHk_04G010226 [Glycine max]|nr:hypothetical protein GmHk_04G010226 [Glycine max]